MARTKRFRFTTLRDVVKPGQPYDRTIEKKAITIAKKIAARGGGQRYIEQYAASLQEIERRYGASIMCEVIQFQTTYGLNVEGAYYLNCVADCKVRGREDILERAVTFIVSQGMYGTKFVEVARGIERWGEQDLRRGMALAPRPSRINPDPRYPWNRARVWQQEKERYCRFTTELGLETLLHIVRLLRSYAVSAADELHILYCCAHASRDTEAISRGVVSAITMVEEQGLPVASFLVASYLAINERHGTASEVAAILALAAEYELETISAESMRLALEWWRQPGKRHIVLESFQQKSPGTLSLVAYALTFGAFFQIGFDGSTSPLVKRIAQDYRREAHARTKEIVASRLNRYGLHGAMHDIVEVLASNPLLPDAILRLNKTDEMDASIDRAEERYGRDLVRGLCRSMPDIEVGDIGLALRRASPLQLRRILDKVERYEMATIIRSVGWYGLKETWHALKIVRACSLEAVTIFSVIRQLRIRSPRLLFTRPHVSPLGEVEVVTPGHQAAYQGFCQLPAAQKYTLARAIRLYRRVHNIIFWRILTGRV
jgi:hypothetical protein